VADMSDTPPTHPALLMAMISIIVATNAVLLKRAEHDLIEARLARRSYRARRFLRATAANAAAEPAIAIPAAKPNVRPE